MSATQGFRALVLAIALLAGLVAPAAAGEPLRGIALVIGLSDYEHLARLPNPARDARQVEELLNRLGMDTDMVEDRDARRLRRDLDGFIEDAEGADVALVYYSGHGIESGGRNYLVPVDADVDATDEASARLISVENLLAALRQRAKITIVLLDACRTNPFPAGARLKLDAAAPATEISASGLGAPRGAVSLLAANDNGNQSLGAVIGFAASPGQVALDGPEGGTSPYAAALLKHLGANDFDFADVMTMVSEEVYLSTRSQQQPWINASLRRLLYFGNVVEQEDGDEALIRGARRNLLMTIAATPAETRSLVETLASNDSVPLAELYGMLDELDVDTSAGSDQLALQLRAGAENLKRFMAERVEPARNDPELVRYAELANAAQDEGAIALAREFRERASARADELRAVLDTRENELKADRLEIAATYAEEAQSASLASDYLRSAERYRDAYDQALRWDSTLAWRYKTEEARALVNQGDIRGDRDSLQRAIAAHNTALGLVTRSQSPQMWAANKSGLGAALTSLARIGIGTEQVDAAIDALDEALEVNTREANPSEWASTQLLIGNAALLYGHTYGDVTWLQRAADAYGQADEVLREIARYDWVGTQENRGLALYLLGYYQENTDDLKEAVRSYERALAERTRDNAPQDWARLQSNMGSALLALERFEPGGGYRERGIAALNGCLAVMDRQRYPMDWAIAQHYVGDAMLSRGKENEDSLDVRAAIAAFDRSLEVWTVERAPIDRATSMARAAEGYELLGLWTGDKASVQKALDMTREARTVMVSGGGYAQHDSYYAARIDSIEQALAGMK